MRNLYSLKHKFLVLVSALVIYGLVPTMLSGHSTGAWMATSACGKQAFIFVSAWHPVGGITPAEGLYIDRNQNGMIIQSGGINKSVCNTPTGEYTGTTGVANSTDYFPMSTWISSTTANLPNDNLTSHTDPAILNGLKKWLKVVKGIYTKGFTITPIWTPSGGIGIGNAESFMFIDLDVSKLQSGNTLAHVATTTCNFDVCGGCAGFCTSPQSNGAFQINLAIPETPPVNYVSVQNLKVSLDGNCKKTITPLDLLMGFKLAFQQCFDFELRINDSDPTNGGVIDGVSPVGGWTYGVFKNGQLIAQG